MSEFSGYDVIVILWAVASTFLVVVFSLQISWELELRPRSQGSMSSAMSSDSNFISQSFHKLAHRRPIEMVRLAALLACILMLLHTALFRWTLVFVANPLYLFFLFVFHVPMLYGFFKVEEIFIHTMFGQFQQSVPKRIALILRCLTISIPTLTLIVVILISATRMQGFQGIEELLLSLSALSIGTVSVVALLSVTKTVNRLLHDESFVKTVGGSANDLREAVKRTRRLIIYSVCLVTVVVVGATPMVLQKLLTFTELRPIGGDPTDGTTVQLIFAFFRVFAHVVLLLFFLYYTWIPRSRLEKSRSEKETKSKSDSAHDERRLSYV